MTQCIPALTGKKHGNTDISLQTIDDQIEAKPNDVSQNTGKRDSFGEKSEITYHYLSFDTELPRPAYLSQPAAGSLYSTQPAQCPNLDRFTSPFQWSEKRKSFMTWLSCAATALTAYTAGSYSMGQRQMSSEWGVSEVAAAVGVTTFTCGFGIAPMVLAPVSEISGRRPVFVASGLLFVVFQLLCAVTPTYAGMVICRFLAGCCGSTFSTMVGGVVSDIYKSDQRNKAMALFSGSALFGTGLGPLISGVLAQHASWRWIFYFQVITGGIMMVFVVAFFKETRGGVLLSRKAKTINGWIQQLESQGHFNFMMALSPAGSPGRTPALMPQRIRWKVEGDEDRSTIARMITTSLCRPFHLLVTEPVVFFFSIWISFAWSVLYLTFSAIPLVFTTNFNFETEQNGAVFTAICVAAIISTVASILQESMARKYFTGRRRVMLDTPEGRLYFSCIQSALLPIGCFWFAWTCSGPSWIVPTIAIGCATMGVFSIYLAVFNYLADAYQEFASSALAAQSFCRNIMAGAFPLFTERMFIGLTYEGAGSLLGGLGALLTIVPWVLFFYGPEIRSKSRLANKSLS
ncbi:hypothetical protein Q7P37_010380 [Cladosporium fusiforme]